MWEYQARCVKVTDGDSVTADLDLGFSVTVREKLRLSGLDTPELRSPDPALRERAAAAKARVLALLPPGTAFTVTTSKGNPSGSYGRFLARVILPDGRCLNDLLLSEGLAVTYAKDSKGVLVRGETALAAGAVPHRIPG